MPITYPASSLAPKAELLLGGVWTNISTYVLWDAGVTIQRGINFGDDYDGPPNSITLTLKNTDRRFSPRYVAGPYYGLLKQSTRLRVSYDVGTGYVQRAEFEIPTFSPRRAVGEVPLLRITAVDARKRYADSSKPLTSPLYNTTLVQNALVTFAPMEEGQDATQITLATEQGSVNSVGTFDFASDTTLPGAKQALKLTATSGFSINVGGYVFGGHWQVEWFMKMPSAPAGTTLLRRVYLNSSTMQRWDIAVDASNYRVVAYSLAGAIVADSGFVSNAGLYLGQWIHCRLTAQNTSGSQFQWLFATTPLDAGGSSVSGSGITGQVGNVSTDAVLPQSGLDGVSMAGSAIYDAYEFSGTAAAANGNAGESPGTRFLRICAEEGIACVFRSGTDNDLSVMGPQRGNGFMANVGECLRVNEGWLDADTSGNLRMTSRTYVENRAVAMTISHSSFRMQALEVADSDKLLVNKFTADRTQGGSVTVSATSGPMNANDPEDDPLGVGVYPDGETYNLNSDAALADHASYRVYKGTIDHPAAEKVTLHFGRPGVAAALLATWITMDTFQRIQITSPPPDYGPDTLDQIVVGWTERFNSKELSVDLFCVPAAAFTVDVLEDDARLDTKHHYLLHALSTSDTAVRVGSTSSEVDATFWDHRDGNYLIRMRGEDWNVTNVTNLNAQNAPTFIAAGTGASASSGTLAPGLPAGMQKGDCMLLFSSTRNAGTGTCATPTTGGVAWTRIADCDNMSLFGRIHTGTESAPSVPFINGAASEDTLAQICAFRNLQLTNWPLVSARVLAWAVSLNGSQQNIDLPAAVTAARQNTVQIFCGWKQDDWSSAASIGLNRIGTVVSTAGNDAAMVWDYKIVTGVEATLTGTQWVITGGAAAFGNGMVVVLDGNVQTLTVTRGVNGVALTHAAGQQVRVKNPIILGLPSG